MAGRLFKGGRLPVLAYANRQAYGRERHDRPMHSHDHVCELLLCYQGFGRYNIGSFSYLIQEGDLIYYNAGEVHEVVSGGDTEIGTYCLGFTGVELEGLPLNHFIPADSPHVRPAGASFRFFAETAEKILALNGGTELERLAAQTLGTSLLLMASAQDAAAETRTEATSASYLTLRIKDYIDAHYMEPLKLPDIAAHLNCSVTYLAHTFKAATGYSPIQYAIRRRIGRAQTLLISTDYSATHIATLVGYDNTNYFNALFTRTVGLSPIRYRQKYLESLKGERNQL